MAAIPFKWEKMDNHTSRAKVVGGWLVRVEVSRQLEEERAGKCPNPIFLTDAITVTFVPDPEHQWEIAKMLDKEKSI